jgi:hypothetical protein
MRKREPATPWNPPKRQLRYFAWFIALCLAMIALGMGSLANTGLLRLTAAGVFALGTVLPGVFRWPYLTTLYPLLWLARRLISRPRADIVK